MNILQLYCPAIVCALLVFETRAIAHDSPEHVIESLTAQLQTEGENATTLVRRAYEYRALGDSEAAAKDFERAIELDPANGPAHVGLARVQLNAGNAEAALKTVGHALHHCAERQKAGLYALRAELHEASEQYTSAIHDYNRALSQRPGELDWILARSGAQRNLGQWDTRIRTLEDAMTRNQSVVLEIELIEALIDARHFKKALPRIERHLAESRWKSAWRVRRARALLGQGNRAEAHRDLHAAIAELDARTSRDTPDPSLLVERGVAKALLGDLSGAEAGLDEAQALGAEAWLTEPLETLLD